jgi:hypothetical protein
VEFQQRLDGKEPKVPSRKAKLLCLDHLPEGFPRRALVVKEAPEETAPAEVAPKKRSRGKGRLPHIDPVWEAATPRLPPKSESRERVKCVKCGLEHELRKRLMFNGDFSYCPDCNEDMFVPVWDDEEETQHAG